MKFLLRHIGKALLNEHKMVAALRSVIDPSYFGNIPNLSNFICDSKMSLRLRSGRQYWIANWN